MSPFSSQPGRHMLDGAIRVFLADMLFPLTGIITVAFLTRQLGPEGYGLLVLTATLVSWVEGNINSMFARATIKLVGEAEDWRPVGSIWARLHLAASCAGTLVLWLLAEPIARLLNEPVLGTYLCLYALDIPLFSLAQAHRHIMLGLGFFRQGALARASRWVSRLLLIVLFVQLGFSVPGAILGSIGASLVELAIGRCYVRPSCLGRVPLLHPALRDYALPLFLSALALSCYSTLDLFALKILGGTVMQAGIYGAAQNLSLFPGLFATAFSPLLLSTLSRLWSRGEMDLAKDMGRQAMRIVLGLLPIAAMIAGAAPEIVQLFFGPSYEQAAPLLAMLIFAAVAVVMVSMTTAILTAAGKPGLTLVLTGPLVPLAILGHLLLIPRFGPLGASLVTTLCAGLGALAAVLAVHHLWGIAPPVGTLGRSVLVSVLAYALAVLWPTTGLLVLVKLAVTGVVIVFAYLVLREFSADEIVLARSLVGWAPAPAQQPRNA